MSMYSGRGEESVFVKSKLVTYDMLKETIQASDNELRDALKAMCTIEVDGEYLINVCFPVYLCQTQDMSEWWTPQLFEIL